MRYLCRAILPLVLLLAASYAQPPASVSDLTQKAQSGEAQAQFELGRAYENGAGVEHNDALATYWYAKAAAQDYAEAENSLGVMYALGRSVNRSPEEAVNWYRKAAKHGLAQAFYNIGVASYNGDGVNQDLDSSYAFMQLAQSKGYAQAADALRQLRHELQGDVGPAELRLAQMLEAGGDVPQDVQGAIKVYSELADSRPKDTFSYAQPPAQAQLHLCRLYLEGKSVAQDYARARSRCKTAAKYLSAASLLLGKMEAQGLGGPKNLKKATQYYQTAAVGSVPEAFLEVAKIKLASGSHQDEKEAYFWLYVAQQQNVPTSTGDFKKAAAGLSSMELASLEKEAKEWLAVPANYRKKPRIR